MDQLLGKAHRYMKAEGKQGRRKYLRYGKAAYVSTPLPRLLQALLPGAPSWPAPRRPGPLQRERNALCRAGTRVREDRVTDGILGRLGRLATGIGNG